MEESMRKKKIFKTMKKIMCLCICIVMIITLSPIMSLADDYSDGCECWYCDHFHWGDNKCDDCGGCSSDCNNDCYQLTHCYYCDACILNSDFCEESRNCYECLQQEGEHCPDCNECYCYDSDPLCGNCFRCPDCVDSYICDECGWCMECGEHCEICGACWPDMCEEGGEHCAECCEDFGWICGECGKCAEARDIEICDSCGLCMECCLESACPDCGLCVRDSAYDVHFCDECGTSFCNTDMCAICGLCEDCCMALAEEQGCDCRMYCWLDITDEHMCQDCGACLGSCGAVGVLGCDDACDICDICDEECNGLLGEDACEYCSLAGEYRCLDCCKDNSELMGCDCDEKVCVNSPEWDEHIATVHGEVDGEHNIIPKNTWDYDAENHWHSCRVCDDEKHISSKNAHVFNEQGRCKICGYSSDGSIVIVKQPKNAVASVESEDSEAWIDNKVVFTIAAMGKDGKKGLNYKWYYSCDGGKGYEIVPSTNPADTTERILDDGTLEYVVPSDSCYTDYEFYCVVSDNYGNSVTSSKAKLISRHHYTYLNYMNSKCTKDENGHILGCCGCIDKYTKKLPHIYSEWTWNYDNNGNKVNKTRICKDCGYEQEYFVHKHKYNMESAAVLVTDESYTPVFKNGVFESIEGTVKDIETDKNIKAGITKYQHYVECSKNGCELIHKEDHVWGGWQLNGDETDDSDAGLYRECLVCGYVDDQVQKDQDGNDIIWKKGVHPITTTNCSASVHLTKENVGVKLTPNKIPDKTFEKYKVTCNNTEYNNWINQDVLTVPTMSSGKYVVEVEALYKDGCKHEKVEIINQVEPTCTKMGYTGDTVCSSCGKIIQYGSDVDELGHAEVVLATEPVVKKDAKGKDVYTKYPDGKSYKVYSVLPKIDNIECNSTSEYYSNYTGDKICSRCNEVIEKGKYTEIKHKYVLKNPTKTGGRTGRRIGCNDIVEGNFECLHCKATKTVKKVKGHTNTEIRDYIEPTCESNGYTGDTYCKDCGEFVSAGKAIKKLSHEWDEGTVVSELSDKKLTMRVCTKCGVTCTDSTKAETEDNTEEDTKKDDTKKDDANKEDTNKEDTNKDNSNKDNTDKDNEEPTIEPVKPINDTDTHFVINKEYVIKSKVNVVDLISECMTILGGDSSKITGYELSDKSLAKINSKGILSLKKKGTLTINAINKVGKGKKAQKNILCSLTIDIVDMEIVKKVDINYLTDETKLLNLIPNKPLNQKIEFSQTEKSKKIGTVSENGVFYPIKDGKVKIKCTIGDDTEKVSYTIGINIKTPSINIKEGLKLKESKTRKIKLKNLPKSAKNNVKWSVADASKVEIISSGDRFIKIKALESGDTEIIADIEGRKIRRRISIVQKH